MMKRIAVALCVLAVGASAVAQDTFPSKPITFVVPYPAGGGTDVVARALADEMGRRMGQTILVDNKPGAAGILGTMTVVKAPADGHTVLISLVQSALTNQFLFKKLPYDTRRDLAFVTEIATAPLVLAVNASNVPARDLGQLQAWAAKNKGKVNYGSWGPGSFPHLAGSLLSSRGELDMTHVAYKGEAPMTQDLVGGQISFVIGSPLTLKPFIDDGRVRPLAVTGHSRSSVLPQVPTFAESGDKDPAFQLLGWMGMLVPKSTPAPVVARLEKEAREAINSTALRARFQALGLLPLGSTAAEFQADFESALPVWEKLVKVSGAQLD
ncbi:tripartite tricarboxylate transporter substrate binding protein [Variovorax dokdonensis]|uniref:Tripartite tricarboxylate transporter substrate binding protein n=1 Tax=Variovorax dokdonensis TaxID=344883 RepID=A0ABT7NGM9_9BURK|nr:tripartite tricarboxylate transporter substrate binding protein [Variovorax dokdonensis]MDM0047097.1 tripartite tricarboxylate transporter substrate binding protein [Variovorax dokdonensis]